MNATSESNSIFSNFAKLFSGLALVQIINFIFSLILPKYVTATSFAEFGIFISILFILIEIINAKLDIAVMLGKNEEQAESIANAAIGIAIIISGLLLLIALLFFFFVPIIYIAIPFITLLYGIHQPIITLLNKQEQYHKINLFRTIQVSTTAITTLVLAYLKVPHALIIGFGIGLFLSTWYTLHYIKFNIHFEQIKTTLKQFDQFPKFGTWSSLLNNVSRNIVPLIMSPFFAPQLIGYFTYATRLLNAPTGMYSSALGQVYFKNAAHLDAKTLKSTTIKICITSFLLGLIPTILFLLFGQELFLSLFGTEWQAAGKVAQYLILWYFAGVIVSPISSILDIKYKLKFEFIYNLIVCIARIAVIVLGGIFQHFYLSILLFTIVGILSNLYLLFYIHTQLLEDDSN